MCEVKLMNGKITSELMTVFYCVNGNATKANALRWFWYVLRKEDNAVRIAMNFEVSEKRKKRCPKSTYKVKVKDSLQTARLKEKNVFELWPPQLTGLPPDNVFWLWLERYIEEL